ncbi:MAG: radical SAM protein [Deltaproteobacteria bacterium]|nr:radical SAM protein [Deltaproteobacteria bacterium]
MKKKVRQSVNIMKFVCGGIKPTAGPLKVQWDVLWRCNSKCLTCDRWQEKEGREIMPFEREKRLLEELAALGTFSVAFSGGEPFLRKDMCDLIKFAKGLGLTVSLNSNALLIKESLAEKIIDSNLDMIYFSLDGGRAETNDYIRGIKGGFEKTFKAVKLLREKRNEKPKIFINCTVNNKNVSELPELVRACCEAGVDGITIQPAHSCDEMGFYMPDELKLSHENIPLFNRELGKLMRDYSHLFPMMEDYFKYFGTFIENPAELYKFRCVAAYTTVQIHPNGDVYSCPVAFEKMGSLMDASFKEVWFSQKADDLRRKVKKGDHPMCWFTCVAPVNIFLSYFHPLRLYKLMNPKLMSHILYKMGG